MDQSLSSMPLTFNLLGPLALDLKLASRVLRLIDPDLRDAEARALWFEHSPGRGDASLTGDGTAFDATIAYTRRGQTGFVAIEVKYSEGCQEPAPAIRPRYDEIAEASHLFLDSMSPALRLNPLQQFFREHCLAQAMLARQDFDEGRLLVIAPRLNHLVFNATDAYAGRLKQPSTNQALFQVISLEAVIDAIAQAGEENYARALYRRYADFWLVDGEIELALVEVSASNPDARTDGAQSGLTLIKGDRVL